ncbi:MAG: hypothetical protein K0R38_2345, partial [Polyangiaceae bacterium]|nr:hypothetical protein [Polyangiaceae bacterium]
MSPLGLNFSNDLRGSLANHQLVAAVSRLITSSAEVPALFELGESMQAASENLPPGVSV